LFSPVNCYCSILFLLSRLDVLYNQAVLFPPWFLSPYVYLVTTLSTFFAHLVWQDILSLLALSFKLVYLFFFPWTLRSDSVEICSPFSLVFGRVCVSRLGYLFPRFGLLYSDFFFPAIDSPAVPSFPFPPLLVFLPPRPTPVSYSFACTYLLIPWAAVPPVFTWAILPPGSPSSSPQLAPRGS